MKCSAGLNMHRLYLQALHGIGCIKFRFRLIFKSGYTPNKIALQIPPVFISLDKIELKRALKPSKTLKEKRWKDTYGVCFQRSGTVFRTVSKESETRLLLPPTRPLGFLIGTRIASIICIKIVLNGPAKNWHIISLLKVGNSEKRLVTEHKCFCWSYFSHLYVAALLVFRGCF